MPVASATQALESLAKTGQTLSAQITDEAVAEPAECVFLNKGPHLFKAIQSLENFYADAGAPA